MGKPERNEEEIAATVAELPISPPDDVIETVKKRMHAAKLVYRAGWYTDLLTGLKEKTALVKCTNCGEEYHLEHVPLRDQGCSRGYGMSSDPFGFVDPLDGEVKYSYKPCVCPECGCGADAVHIGKINVTETVENKCFVTAHNVRGHLVLLSWMLCKLCNKQAEISYSLRLYEGVSVIDGVAVRFTGYENGLYYSIKWNEYWTARTVFRDPCDVWPSEDIIGFDSAMLEATDASKSALDVFIREGGNGLRLAAYLRIWSKYPQIENLVRKGLSKLVSDIIKHSTEYSSYSYTEKYSFKISCVSDYIDVKKKKPHEMLRIEKSDLPLAASLDLDELALYGLIKQTYGIGLNEMQIEQCKVLGLKSVLEFFKNKVRGFSPPVVKTINYLYKIKNVNKARLYVCYDASYLRDYWKMLAVVYDEFPALPSDLLYPKNIRKMHDEMIERKKEVLSAKCDEKIRTFAKSLESLNFEDSETGLLIRPCADQKELNEEGKSLHHCVSTYAERYAQRKTSIFFIRKIETPNVPFFTLEYNKGKVVQNRGCRNCERTDEVRRFEDKWLNYIKNQKETISNGKRNIRNNAKQRAGA